MSGFYDIFLDEIKLGTTALEKADPSMGVVFGQIIPSNELSYIFIKDYCLKNNIDFTDYPEDKLISTLNIDDLQISNVNGVEIKGLASSISGMDSEGFDIYIEGIPYPFYQEEFPQHVKGL